MFDLAARQGHIGAMYALSVIHLEGHEHYHNCRLSIELMQAVIRKGFLGEISMEAKQFYSQNEIFKSTMLYLEGGFLGLEEATVNAGILLDRFKFLEGDKTFNEVYEGKESTFSKIFGFLGITKEEVRSTIFEDIEGLYQAPETSQVSKLPDNNDINLENVPILSYQNITSLQQDINQNYIVATRALTLASLNEHTYAFVRLGDYYYYGKHSKGQDYAGAYNMYKRATFTNSSIDFKA